VPTTYTVWLICHRIFSVLACLDLATDSLFTATTLNVLDGSRGANLQKVYSLTWPLKSIHVPQPSLSHTILAIWVVSLAQVLWPFINTFTKEECGCGTTMTTTISADHDKKVKQQTTYFNERTNDKELFLQLAHPAGIASVSQITVAAGHSAVIIAPTANNVLCNAVSLGKAMESRVLLSYVMENSAQVYLQVFVFSLRFCVARVTGHEERAMKQQVFSLMLSGCMAMLKLEEAFSFLTVAAKVEETVTPTNEDETRMYQRFRKSVWLVRITIVIMLLVLLVSALKLAGAFFCDSAIWTVFAVLGPTKGCLEPPALG